MEASGCQRYWTQMVAAVVTLLFGFLSATAAAPYRPGVIQHAYSDLTTLAISPDLLDSGQTRYRVSPVLSIGPASLNIKQDAHGKTPAASHDPSAIMYSSRKD